MLNSTSYHIIKMKSALLVKFFCHPTGAHQPRPYLSSRRGTAPEVFSQKPYGKPADVFSFGIMLWIMISLGDPVEKPEGGGRFGVSTYRLRVSTSNLRPQRPEGCPPDLWDMMELCWHQVADLRPSFENLKVIYRRVWALLTR